MTKAKVVILQQRVTGNKTFIETDVTIKSIKSRRRFEVPNNATATEVEVIITRELIREEVINVGREFEVEI